MDYSPEKVHPNEGGTATSFAEGHSNVLAEEAKEVTVSIRAFLIWLLLVTPLCAACIVLATRLNTFISGSDIFALVTGIGTAAFITLVLGMDIQFQQKHQKERTINFTEDRKEHIAHVILAASVMPILLLLLGVVSPTLSEQFARHDMVLFLCAVTMGVLNAISAFILHFLVKEFIFPKEKSETIDPSHSSFEFTQSIQVTRYAAPIYPALSGMVLLAFFAFAFALKEKPDLLVGVIAIFIFGIISLFALNRYHNLSHVVKKEHVVSPQETPDHPEQTAHWTLPIIVGVLLVGSLAAAMPLDELVQIGQLFRKNPPPPSNPLSDVKRNTGVSMIDNVLSSEGGSLLFLLLLIAIMSFFLWLLRRWLKKSGIWNRLIKRFLLLWMKAKQWFGRLLRRRKHTDSAEEPGEMTTQSEGLVDVFDQPNLLAQFSPAQIIIITYNLMLNLAVQRGWLRQIARPPFEIMGILKEKAQLNLADLTRLTWLYVQAAFSRSELGSSAVHDTQNIWARLKAQLLAEPENEQSSDVKTIE